MTGKKGMRIRKPTVVPAKFSEHFLAEMDTRCRVARAVKVRLQRLMNDLGGEDNLSYQRRSLVKRIIHLEALIEHAEVKFAKGEEFKRFKDLYEGLDLQEEAKEKIGQEIDKFSLMDPNSSEFIVSVPQLVAKFGEDAVRKVCPKLMSYFEDNIFCDKEKAGQHKKNTGNHSPDRCFR